MCHSVPSLKPLIENEKHIVANGRVYSKLLENFLYTETIYHLFWIEEFKHLLISLIIFGPSLYFSILTEIASQTPI